MKGNLPCTHCSATHACKLSSLQAGLLACGTRWRSALRHTRIEAGYAANSYRPYHYPPAVKSDPTTADGCRTNARLFAAIPGACLVVDARDLQDWAAAGTLQDCLGLATGVLRGSRASVLKEAVSRIRARVLQRTFPGPRFVADAGRCADQPGRWQLHSRLSSRWRRIMWESCAASMPGATVRTKSGVRINFVSPYRKTASPADLRYEGGKVFVITACNGAFAQDFGAGMALSGLSHSEQDGYRKPTQQENQRGVRHLAARIN